MVNSIDFITGSTRKFQEIQGFLEPIVLVQKVIDLPEIQEVDARKIIEAKIIEAHKHKEVSPFIVEDTSLYLDAIPGLPGPLIKWFLETIKEEGLTNLALRLGNTKAVARTIIAYAAPGKKTIFFEGEVEGTVVMPRVSEGFGWDLIFVPDGHTKTFAEMTIEEKGALSMRGKAAQKLRDFLIT